MMRIVYKRLFIMFISFVLASLPYTYAVDSAQDNEQIILHLEKTITELESSIQTYKAFLNDPSLVEGQLDSAVLQTLIVDMETQLAQEKLQRDFTQGVDLHTLITRAGRWSVFDPVFQQAWVQWYQEGAFFKANHRGIRPLDLIQEWQDTPQEILDALAVFAPQAPLAAKPQAQHVDRLAGNRDIGELTLTTRSVAPVFHQQQNNSIVCMIAAVNSFCQRQAYTLQQAYAALRGTQDLKWNKNQQMDSGQLGFLLTQYMQQSQPNSELVNITVQGSDYKYWLAAWLTYINTDKVIVNKGTDTTIDNQRVTTGHFVTLHKMEGKWLLADSFKDAVVEYPGGAAGLEEYFDLGEDKNEETVNIVCMVPRDMRSLITSIWGDKAAFYLPGLNIFGSGYLLN